MKKVSQKDAYLSKRIEILASAIDKVYPNIKTLMFRSFIQGVFVALGTTVGLSLVLAIFTFILRQLGIIPAIGDIIKSWQLENYLHR